MLLWKLLLLYKLSIEVASTFDTWFQITTSSKFVGFCEIVFYMRLVFLVNKLEVHCGDNYVVIFHQRNSLQTMKISNHIVWMFSTYCQEWVGSKLAHAGFMIWNFDFICVTTHVLWWWYYSVIRISTQAWLHDTCTGIFLFVNGTTVFRNTCVNCLVKFPSTHGTCMKHYNFFCKQVWCTWMDIWYFTKFQKRKQMCVIMLQVKYTNYAVTWMYLCMGKYG
jgi:hypothetical protein